MKSEQRKRIKQMCRIIRSARSTRNLWNPDIESQYRMYCITDAGLQHLRKCLRTMVSYY